MEFSSQLKHYRSQAGLTQDELAEKIYVTRQTVSNWENDKNYPDVKSLLLLSALFQVSLDTLVKGDLNTMKEQIKQEDIRKLNRDGTIFTVLLLAVIVTAPPLAYFFGIPGLVAWAGLWVVSMVFAMRLEKQKKQHDIQSYREIVAFTEGRQLDELEKAQEVGKRPYQKFLLVLGTAALGFLTAYGISKLLFLLGG